MRRIKLLICLTLMLSGLLTLSPSALAAETQSGAATVAIDDLRQIVAYTESLEAEEAALKESLAAEREATRELAAKTEAMLAATEAEISALHEENRLMALSVDAARAEVKKEKRRGALLIIGAIVLGAAIGAAAN